MKFTISLKKNFQYKFVYHYGKSIANKLLVMYVIQNEYGINRLGISVSKKVGKSVVRSRVTRLIKENYRMIEKRITPGYDIVFIARVGAKDAAYKEVQKAMLHLLKKHGLLTY